MTMQKSSLPRSTSLHHPNRPLGGAPLDFAWPLPESCLRSARPNLLG
jgi:hypothetical protein